MHLMYGTVWKMDLTLCQGPIFTSSNILCLVSPNLVKWNNISMISRSVLKKLSVNVVGYEVDDDGMVFHAMAYKNRSLAP